MLWRGIERCAVWAATVALVLVGATAAFPGAAAAKAWGAPQAVGDGSGVSIAADAAGNALIGWSDGKRVQVRTRAPDNTFGPIRTLAEADVGSTLGGVDVVMDPDGNAVVGWVRVPANGAFELDAAIRAPDGTFGTTAPIAIDVSGRSGFDLAIARGGAAALIWSHDGPPSFPEASIRLPGGGFGQPQRVSPDEQEVDTPRIAVDAQGGAVAVWDNYGTRPETAVRAPGGLWGPVEALGPNRLGSGWPGVAGDEQGNALAVFMTVAPSSSPGATLQARYRPVGGSLGAAEQVSQPPERHAVTTGYFEPAEIGFDAAGTATVLWRDAGTQQLFASSRPRGGSFGEPAAVSLEGADSIRLAVSAGGAAVAAWAPPSNSEAITRPVLTAVRAAGGAFEAPQTQTGRALDFDVAADAAGNALLAWSVNFGDADCAQVEVSAYSDSPISAAPGPPPPPQCFGGPPDGRPPTLTLGGATRQHALKRRRATLSVRCSEKCKAVAKGTLVRGRRHVATRPVTRKLRAGRRTSVTLLLPKTAARRLGGAPTKLVVQVSATDAAHNRTTRRRTIALAG